MWKVAMTSEGAGGGHGEAVANVTVLLAARVNTLPKPVIAPLTQTVTMPTSTAHQQGNH